MSGKSSLRALSGPFAALPEFRGDSGSSMEVISLPRAVPAFGTQPQLPVRGFRLVCQIKILARVLTVAVSGMIIFSEWPFIMKHFTRNR